MELVYFIVTTSIAFVGLVGTAIVRDRYVIKLINDGDEKTRECARHGDEKLHEKVNSMAFSFNDSLNKLRDSVHDHYVGKEHFESSVESLNRSIEQMNKSIIALTQRIDDLLKRDL